jgi:hypothetical protein
VRSRRFARRFILIIQTYIKIFIIEVLETATVLINENFDLMFKKFILYNLTVYNFIFRNLVARIL